MFTLNLPQFSPIITQNNDQLYIKNVSDGRIMPLTPEEWVRQHILNYLHSELGYSYNLMKLEYSTFIHRNYKRPDILVFDTSGKVEILVECKAPFIELSVEHIQQLSEYAAAHKPQYLMLSNGMKHLYFEASDKLKEVDGLPLKRK
jgi:hypothetical protein